MLLALMLVLLSLVSIVYAYEYQYTESIVIGQYYEGNGDHTGIVDREGKYLYIVGRTYGGDATYLAVFDLENMSLVWYKEYGSEPTDGELRSSVVVVNGSYIYIAGCNDWDVFDNSYGVLAHLLRLDLDGNIIWIL